MIARVPGNLGDPAAPWRIPAGAPATANSRMILGPASAADGDERGTPGIAKRRKRSAAKGLSGSRSVS